MIKKCLGIGSGDKKDYVDVFAEKVLNNICLFCHYV